ncbi:MAG: hypothetical protein RL000_553 [Bacteroidota bacterium]
MKQIIRKSLLLISITLCQFIDLNPAFAKSVTIISKDSLKVATTKFNDNAPLGKISIPDKNMIRKADNEIHRNMKADIAEAKAMMKTLAGLTPADLNIHTDFFKSFFIEIPNYTVVSDNEISNQFSAENINAINLKNMQISDLQINKQFYSSK